MAAKPDSIPTPTTEQRLTDEDAHDFLRGLTPRGYMPTPRAAYILDDMSMGQLVAFEPREFVREPSSGVELVRAALALFWGISEHGFADYSDDAIIALWDIRSRLKSLQESVPNAVAFINCMLMGDSTPPLHMVRLPTHRASKEGQATPGYVYVLRSPTGAFKIGLTKNPTDRLHTFSVKLPFEVEFELLIKTDDMRSLETELHARYADKHINGEWFTLTESDIADLRQLDGAL